MKKNRPWKKTGLLAVAALALGLFAPWSSALAVPLPGGTLDPLTVPKYVTPLVIPPAMPKSTASPAPLADYDIAVRQFQQQILPGGIWNKVNGRTDLFGPTTVWSYGRAEDPLPDISTAFPDLPAGVAPAPNSTFNYPAFTVENSTKVATTVRWINDLVADPAACAASADKTIAACNFLPHLVPVDQTLHWANPPQANCVMGNPNRTDCATAQPDAYTGPVPIVTHVHGSHVQPHSDGYPEAWWLPGAPGTKGIPASYAERGSVFTQADNANAVPGSAFYSYENTQPAATLWYHDHALGMTRANVYAGPAGFWLVRGGRYGDAYTDDGTTATAADAILPRPAPRLNVDGTPQDVNGLTLASVRDRIREIPIAIQDRSFNYDPGTGATSLFYPDNRAFFEGFANNTALGIPFIGNPAGTTAGPSDISAIWNPEAFFNTMVVNGSTWPLFEVADARYRLRLLNGCNSRTLNLSMKVVVDAGADTIYGTADDTLGAEIPFYQIGAEQGFLPQVVMIRTGFATPLAGDGTIPVETALPDPAQALLMMPAERADVIVDFSGLPNGTRIRIFNTGPDSPFGHVASTTPADPDTTGQVMEFAVNTTLRRGSDAITTPPQNLVLPAERALGVASNTRQLSLNELGSDQVCAEFNAIDGAFVGFLFSRPAGDPTFQADCAAAAVGAGNIPAPMAPRMAQLGIVTAGAAVAKAWGDPITEFPLLNTIEMWELFNVTEDAHPIHLHLVRVQVVNREELDPAELLAGNLVLTGTISPPFPNELGYKDSVFVPPGAVTRIKARFDIAGLYVWHCHIVEHEDNEMMRPFTVIAAAPATGVTVDPGATPSPQPAGTAITFTAAATGGDPTGPYQYKFYWRPAGVGTPWTLGQGYSTSATWQWDTTTLALPAGNYRILVRTRHANSKVRYEAQQVIPFTLSP